METSRLSFFIFFPASGNEMSVSPGRRFMIDLLVSSLMADGGLESALNAAITAEIQVSVLNVLVTLNHEVLQTSVFKQDIEAKKEAQKEKEIDEQEANASTMHRCRTMLDKDLINTGIYESAGKQSLPLVQLVQQLLRYLLVSDHFIVHTNCQTLIKWYVSAYFMVFTCFTLHAKRFTALDQFLQEHCLPDHRKAEGCCSAYLELFRGWECQQGTLRLSWPVTALPEAAG